VFKGTRVTLRTVLASLAAGDSEAQILRISPVSKQKTSKPQSCSRRLRRKKIFLFLLFHTFDEDKIG